jgi:octaprenyl-diphosphate synthase
MVGTATLTELYAPIAGELEQAAQILRDELISDDASLAELHHHAERFHGKRLRPALLLLAGRACGQVRPEHALLAAVVEMIHLATLVHDDVLDNGQVRRRTATVNCLWGNARAVLLGDILFSRAYRLCNTLDTPEAARLIAQAAIAVCEGEIKQIERRGDTALSEEAYFDIVTQKTASLLGVAGYLGAKYAGADEATSERLRAFGIAVGIAFQVTDDLLDLVGDESLVGKSLGRDLEQGEYTLPVIHFLRTGSPERRAEMEAALQAAPDQRGEQVLRLLNGSASVAYARRCAEQHVRSALDNLAGLPASNARNSLQAVGDFVLARRF